MFAENDNIHGLISATWYHSKTSDPISNIKNKFILYTFLRLKGKFSAFGRKSAKKNLRSAGSNLQIGQRTDEHGYLYGFAN